MPGTRTCSRSRTCLDAMYRVRKRDVSLRPNAPRLLPISSVLDQGAALRATRAESRPAASRPGRLRRRGGEPPTTAGPPPRTPLIQTHDDHGQAARKPTGRPDRGSGLPTAAPVQPQDWLAPGLPPRPGKPRGSLSRCSRSDRGGPALPGHGRSQPPEEPSAGKIDLPTICPQPVVNAWTQPDSARQTTTAPDQHLCWSGAVSAPGGG